MRDRLLKPAIDHRRLGQFLTGDWVKNIPALTTDLIKTQVLSYAFTFLLHAVGTVMAFSVLGLIAKGIKWKESKVFMAFSDNSMVIYLFHQQIIYFTITWLNGVVSPEINTLVNFVVSLFLSILIGFVLRRFKVTRILVGEK